MSKSVSNDALWEKLLEISERLYSLSVEQKSQILEKEQVDIASDVKANKEEIVKKLEKYIQGLGTHCDSLFKSIYKNLEQLDENTHGIYEILSSMWGIMRESEEQSDTKSNKSYIYFKLFKVKKTSLIIAILGLLVFILTVFCMKQQNDYSLLNRHIVDKVLR